MRHILVTGANKGIGLAIAEAILKEHADTFVFLGARDRERGRAAAAGLVSEQPAWKERIQVVALDVTNAGSVSEATGLVADGLRGDALYGLVNNAGIGGDRGLDAMFETNTLGVERVFRAFAPLLASTARIVNVTSAAGPSFVATCSLDRQRFFLDAQTTWPALRAFMDECLQITGGPPAFAAKGLGDGSPYGLSKACANTYTLILAREHPSLGVNACTPGFIITDMTRHYVESQAKSPADLGMKTPADGAKAPLHLLFGALEGNGRYYGSDGKRSPLDRYRGPGAPQYTGA